jgi:hypothetical protein
VLFLTGPDLRNHERHPSLIDVRDRTKDVEGDARRAVRKAVDDDEPEDKATAAIDSLKSAIDDLTVKVNRLVALQAEARKSTT